MIKVFTTKNYFIGLIYLVLAVILTLIFSFFGLIVVGIILGIAVVLYVIFGISYIIHAVKKKVKRKR